MSLINAGIIGGAGYTGGELIRLLLHHPKVNLKFIHSNSQAGKPIDCVHPDLYGLTSLVFTDQIQQDIDVLFLCSGHGRSRSFLEENKGLDKVTIIDLSADFRIKNKDHSFIYGLPELQKEKIKQTSKIANCGCFATAIQLALLPLAAAQLLQNEIHVHAITGSTGAGQSFRESSHFSWRNNNVSAYKIFQHQHLKEIRQSLKSLQGDFDQAINFIPIRGNFTRGIFSTIYTNVEWSEKKVQKLYQDFYQDEPFVILSDRNPSLKQVVNTNNCILFIEKHDDKIVIVSMIDNLLKGACGQAVQNMNLVFGLEEKLGLELKAVAF